MEEYGKIANVFKFDEKYKEVVGINSPFYVLKDIMWCGTEKIDGTNIRIFWDGHQIQIAGRTDRAVLNNDLKEYLENVFLTKEMEYVFEQMFGKKEVYLFGEGYGAKIQAGGGLYSETPKFILFDVKIDNYNLTRDKVEEIGERLGLDVVPIVFSGTLQQAVKTVSLHLRSEIGDHSHEMEGLVLFPAEVQLYDKYHNLIKCKCKHRDLINANLTQTKIEELFKDKGNTFTQ